MAPVSSKAFFDIQATIKCGFTLKLVCHMIITDSHCRFLLLTHVKSWNNQSLNTVVSIKVRRYRQIIILKISVVDIKHFLKQLWVSVYFLIDRIKSFSEYNVFEFKVFYNTIDYNIIDCTSHSFSQFKTHPCILGNT